MAFSVTAAAVKSFELNYHISGRTSACTLPMGRSRRLGIAAVVHLATAMPSSTLADGELHKLAVCKWKGDSNWKTASRVPKRNHIARLQRLARERAEAQARRVPWQRLLQTRNEYIDWQEFYLWGSVLESEKRIPNWLIDILDERCRGICRK